MKRNAFTLIELIIAVVVLLVVGGVLLKGCAWITAGGSGQGSLIVNPYHNSTAKIQVIRSYAIGAADEISGNVYRIYAKVLEDSDGNVGNEETFEVRDSWLDGNMSSADLFGKMVDNGIFNVKCRGERSGVASAFRGITGVETVEE